MTGLGPLVDTGRRTTLVPGPAAPVAFGCTAIFLALIGAAALSAGFENSWWIVVPTWLLAATAAFAVVRRVANRTRAILDVTPERVTFGGTTIDRASVTGVRFFKELRFKGVRLDLEGSKWVGISAGQHDPIEVLRAFREAGYPMSGD
jgi:hypothetical protein